MSSPTQLRDETLSTLRGTRSAMSTAKWLISIGKQPLEVQREAAFKRLDVEQAILALGNETLSNIGQKLKDNETELVEGREALIKARENLNQVKDVLSALGKVLDLVAKIVKFPMGL